MMMADKEKVEGFFSRKRPTKQDNEPYYVPVSKVKVSDATCRAFTTISHRDPRVGTVCDPSVTLREAKIQKRSRSRSHRAGIWTQSESRCSLYHIPPPLEISDGPQHTYMCTDMHVCTHTHRCVHPQTRNTEDEGK